MLRVALIITELDPGGAERQLVNLATGLDRRFFKPRVFALGEPPSAGRDVLVERLADAEVPVEFFHARRWWQFGPTVEKLAASLRDFQPQVAQTFLFHANVVGSLAAQQAGVPHVSLGIRVNDPRAWRAMIERRAARSAERVVCVSQRVADAARARLRLRGEQCAVIPNGVDVERFEAAIPADLSTFGIPAGVRPILFVGRLDRQKGVDELLRLAPTIAALGQHLLIVGDGPLGKTLRDQASRIPRPCVHFAGWQADIAPLLAAGSLLLAPSRYEGMPNVVLEAMAAALPVLTTPVEGVEEILGEDADQQALPFDVRRWGERLQAIFEAPNQLTEIGVRNRARVQESFSLEAMIRQYERLFGGLAQAIYRP